MGTAVSVELNDDAIADISKSTGFTFIQIEQLYNRFNSLDTRGELKLCRSDFDNIHELNLNPLKAQIVNTFFSYTHGSEEINFQTFAKIMSKFRIHTGKASHVRRTDKLEFAYRVYDTDGDNKISRSDLCNILQKIMGPNTSDKHVEQIADRVITEIDCDGHGQIDFKNFREALDKDDVNLKMSFPFFKMSHT